MAEQKTSCSKCGGHIAFPSELAGQEIPCPHCGESILLPKSKRTIVWVIASVVAIGIFCFGAILISQHKSKPIKSQPQPIISIADTNLSLDALQAKATSGDVKAQFILGWRYYNGEGVATNQTEATNWWSKAAEQGDASAMTAIGDAIFNAASQSFQNAHAKDNIDPATGLPTSYLSITNIPEECFNWYRKAADLGDTNAMWKIIQNGNIGSTNFGTAIDPATGLPTIQPNAEGVHWLQKLANGGDTEAMIEIGSFYLSETNASESLNWLQKAADLGATSAWTTLASTYESGNNGVQKDVETAISWWMKAATNGDISSELHLAQLYRDNEEVKSPEESFKWFLKVAKQSDSNTNIWDEFTIKDAIIPVAMAYDKGLGVAQDKAEAIKWYTKAAEAGDVEGEWRLGVKYDLGDGVDIDKQKALQWYLKAANAPQSFKTITLPGVAESQRNLGYLYRDGEGVTKDAQESLKWFQKAADNGDDHAQFELGKAYETGIGVLQDKQEAFKWYLKAANQGNKSAQLDVGNFYSENTYSPQNRIAAYKWYALAAAQGDENAAKLRDIIAPTMSVQELAEAGKQARAFSVGESSTNDAPIVASSAVASIASDKPAFEVISVTAKPTEQNDMWWRYGYRLTVRNNGMNDERQFFEIQFLDAGGYVIDSKTEEAAIKPGTTEIITGETLLDLPGAAKVSKLKAVWKR